MAAVKLKNIEKRFGDVAVFSDISLDINDGELMVFVGPSGCGKSTLLRIIAGLETASAGDVLIGARVVNSVPVARRGIAMVFQGYALYPHLSVRGNLELGLKQAKIQRTEIDQRVARASEILSMTSLLDRRPAELSGGQRQRVAIGRAIVREPEVFLFDEPLSNLDAALRTQVRYEIASLHQQLNATMVYVTHDQVEAMTLADRIVVIADGKIQQVGTPRELYENPANQFVAGFIGSPTMNFIRVADIASTQQLIDPQNAVEDGVILGVRPDDLLVSADSGGKDWRGHVRLVEYLGSVSYAYIDLENNQRVTAALDPAHTLRIGDHVRVIARGERLFFDPQSGERMR